MAKGGDQKRDILVKRLRRGGVRWPGRWVRVSAREARALAERYRALNGEGLCRVPNCDGDCGRWHEL